MHFGLPSLSTDCNYGPSELITNGENGFLAPVNDQEIFVDYLQKLVESEELRLSFSKESQKTTEKFLDIHVTSSWRNLIVKHLS